VRHKQHLLEVEAHSEEGNNRDEIFFGDCARSVAHEGSIGVAFKADKPEHGR